MFKLKVCPHCGEVCVYLESTTCRKCGEIMEEKK